MAVSLIVIIFFCSIAGRIVSAWVITILAADIIATFSYCAVLLFERSFGCA